MNIGQWVIIGVVIAFLAFEFLVLTWLREERTK